MKSGKVRIMIVAAVVGLLAAGLFGGFASANSLFSAQAGQSTQTNPHPVRLAGKVSSVSATSLVLTTAQGDITANISTGTWIVVQKNGSATQGSVADLVTGQVAIVEGMTTSDAKVVDARTIIQGTTLKGNGANPGLLGNLNASGRLAFASHMAEGTITAINGTTITLKGEKVPQVIVQTNADTVVLNNGFVAVSSLKVGDKVYVIGAPVRPAAGQAPAPGTTRSTSKQIPASRTINAWALRVESDTTRLMAAKVDAINGNTLTVKSLARGRNSITLNVTTATGYKAVSVANKTVSIGSASLSDVKVGSRLIVEGTPNAGGTSFTVTAVILLPGSAAPTR